MDRRRRAGIAGLVVAGAVLVAVPVAVAHQRAQAAGVGSLTALHLTSPTASAGTGAPSPSGSTHEPTRGAAPLPYPTENDAIPVAPQVPAPVRLEIPALGVDAPVLSIGVSAAGTVAIPPDAHDVGWYRLGPAPGSAAGSAVIVGHRDSYVYGLGALYDLNTTAVGDTVTVRRADGSQVRYRVIERRLYPKLPADLAGFFATTGPARLTIITCGGAFLRDAGGYQDNLVVTAVPA